MLKTSVFFKLIIGSGPQIPGVFEEVGNLILKQKYKKVETSQGKRTETNDSLLTALYNTSYRAAVIKTVWCQHRDETEERSETEWKWSFKPAQNTKAIKDKLGKFGMLFIPKRKIIALQWRNLTETIPATQYTQRMGH